MFVTKCWNKTEDEKKFWSALVRKIINNGDCDGNNAEEKSWLKGNQEFGSPLLQSGPWNIMLWWTSRLRTRVKRSIFIPWSQKSRIWCLIAVDFACILCYVEHTLVTASGPSWQWSKSLTSPGLWLTITLAYLSLSYPTEHQSSAHMTRKISLLSMLVFLNDHKHWTLARPTDIVTWCNLVFFSIWN